MRTLYVLVIFHTAISNRELATSNVDSGSVVIESLETAGNIKQVKYFSDL